MNEMTSAAAISIYRLLRDSGIQVWIDGGWAVDALLGSQTRPHEDLDVVVEQVAVPTLRAVLDALGFHDIERDDTSSWNFVLGDDHGRVVDVHAVIIDEQGNGLYGPAEKGVMYPAGSLTGVGVIDGQAVDCISPVHLVAFHSGYELRAQDFHDVSLLCERFELTAPPEYQGRLSPTPNESLT